MVLILTCIKESLSIYRAKRMKLHLVNVSFWMTVFNHGLVWFLLLLCRSYGFVLESDNENNEDRGQMLYSVKNILVEPNFHNIVKMNITEGNKTRLITYMEKACDEHRDIFNNFSQTYFPGIGYYVSAFNGVSEISGERYWELIEHSTGKQHQVGAHKYVPQDGDHVAWNLTEVDMSKFNTTR